MYWPNGVPRVYAVNGPGICLPDTHDGKRDYGGRISHGEEDDHDVEDTERENEADAWAEEPITGLCVSRGGHLFATMTETSIAIWQTKVCLFPGFFFTY